MPRRHDHPGHIRCQFCGQLISPLDYHRASCWTDPGGTTVAAHNLCLRRLGETDLDLPPAA